MARRQSCKVRWLKAHDGTLQMGLYTLWGHLYVLHLLSQAYVSERSEWLSSLVWRRYKETLTRQRSKSEKQKLKLWVPLQLVHTLYWVCLSSNEGRRAMRKCTFSSRVTPRSCANCKNPLCLIPKLSHRSFDDEISKKKKNIIEEWQRGRSVLTFLFVKFSGWPKSAISLPKNYPNQLHSGFTKLGTWTLIDIPVYVFWYACIYNNSFLW